MERLALSRYEVRRELGRGGTGVVYEAYDAKDCSLVALKTIESSVSAEQLYRLKHEFRALADVQHPNLVRFGELACEGGQWFFTMELVRGTDFVEYVRGGADDPSARFADSGVMMSATTIQTPVRARPADASRSRDSLSALRVEPPSEGWKTYGTRIREQRLRSSLAQLVDALGAIHGAGQVHRDVKPSNVLVSSEGRVVVLDFGLVAMAAGFAPSPDEAWIVGTPAYMAPEQIQASAVGPAADWYAVGVMLFFALTGSLPFDGPSAEVLEAKLTREAPSPLSIAPGLPPDLCALAVDLLRMAPAERPRSDEIRARLGGKTAPASANETSQGGGSSPFVGRAEELRLLSLALDEVTAARGARVVVVEGEPGIGKSSLVRRFLRARGERATILAGRCYEQEDVPFKGVDGIVNALSEYLLTLPDHEVEGLVGGGVRYLTALFPVLTRVPSIEAATTTARAVGDPSAVREAAFRELEELAGALARDRTLIFFVDDLQWADRDSIALFRRLLSGVKEAPFLFVATMRTGAEVAPEIAAFAGEGERVSLSGLSSAESRALLDALWMTRGPGMVESRDELVAEAEGHPLFLAELLRSARSEGGKGAARSGAGRLEEVLWERIQARDEIDRKFVAMVAVSGAPIAYEVIAVAARVDAGDAQTRLGSLRAAQLVRVSRRGRQRTVEPYHDRVRESVLLHLRRDEAASLVAMHGRLARALLATTPAESLPEQVFAIVKHFSAAGDALAGRSERVEVARLNLLACREALRATAYDRARAYARTGLALLGEEGWDDSYDVARDLHVEQMRAEAFYADAADTPEAERVFLSARARVRTESDRTDLCVEWITLLTTRRQLGRAIKVGRARLAELGIPVPDRVTPELVRERSEFVRHLRAGRSIDELTLLPELRSPIHEGAIKTLVALVPAAFFLDASLRGWLHIQVVALSLEHGICDAAPYSFSGYGTLLAGHFGEPIEGASFGRLALALNDRFGNERLAARLLFHYGGWHASWVRPYREGKDMLRRAYELARTNGDTTHETFSSTVLSVVSFCESADLVQVEKTARWAMDIASRRKDSDMAGASEMHARYAAALRGEGASPRDLGGDGASDEQIRARLSTKTPTALFYYLFSNAELAYLAGDARRARALLAEAARGSQVIFGLPTMVELCLLECLVAAKLYTSAVAEERPQLANEVRGCMRRLRSWAHNCAVNFEPHYRLALAELVRLRGADRATSLAYERAVLAAQVHGSPKREAFALELAAAHARRQGDVDRGKRLTRQAAEACGRWGAAARARGIERGDVEHRDR